jgi:hypothetical protein
LSEAGFKWECLEFTENGLKFKMDFSNPLKVSKSNGAPDKLNINLKKNTFFSKDTFEELQGGLTMDIPLPKQFPSKDEMKKTEGIANGVKSVMTFNILVILAI